MINGIYVRHLQTRHLDMLTWALDNCDEQMSIIFNIN